MRTILLPIIDNGMGLVRASWAKSLMVALVDGVFSGIRLLDGSISTPYPQLAVNEIGHHFMDTNADELLLMDTDIKFTSLDMAMLLSHNIPYVGGLVPKRTMDFQLAVAPLSPLSDGPFDGEDAVNPLVPALFGRGFCLIKREVFETVRPHVEIYEDCQDGTKGIMRHNYFKPKPGGHSEDCAFCELYHSLGGTPMVDQRIRVGHEGSFVYPLQRKRAA